MVAKRRLLCGALALLVAACSGKDTKDSTDSSAGAATTGGSSTAGAGPKGGSDTSTGGVTVGSDTSLDDYPTVYGRALCAIFDRCWTAFSDATAGTEGCVSLAARTVEQSALPHWKDAVADGRISYHPEVLPDCLRALDAASCENFGNALCPGLFVGTKAAGVACEIDEECSGDSQCLVGASCPGTCGPSPALGEACSNQNTCQSGLVCATYADATRACVKPATLRQSCGRALPCAGLSYCEGSDFASDELKGTCVSRALPHDGEEGAACTGLGTGTLCKAGLTCATVVEDGASVGRCQPKAPSGGACVYATPDACPLDQYCHIDTELGVKPAAGTCTPRPKLGEACRYGTLYTAPCGDGVDQVCHPDTEVCVTAKVLGEACTVGEECFASDCDSTGHCFAPLECEEAQPTAM